GPRARSSSAVFLCRAFRTWADRRADLPRPRSGGGARFSMLTVQNVGLILGDRTILDDISFQISPREKVGLVGVNGAGKSSLLKIIAGKLLPDHGAVSATFSVGYLPQEPRVAFRPDQTALECLLQERGLLALAREIETTARSLGAAR